MTLWPSKQELSIRVKNVMKTAGGGLEPLIVMQCGRCLQRMEKEGCAGLPVVDQETLLLWERIYCFLYYDIQSRSNSPIATC